MKIDNLEYSHVDRALLDEVKSIISFSNSQESLEIFFNLVIGFYDEDEKNINEYFKEKKISNPRVKKTRLNKLLERYGYFIGSDYKLIKFESFSFEDLISFFIKRMSKQDIKSIKFLDSFSLTDKNKFLYTDKLKRSFLDALYNNKKLQVISTINNIKVKIFFKDIVEITKKKYNFNLKYLNSSIYEQLPTILILLENKNNKKLLFLYEEYMESPIFLEVDDNSKNSREYFNLLNSRFDYFYNEKELNKKNIIMPVNSFLTDSFDDDVLNLINNMRITLDSSFENENKIHSRINELTKELIKIKISYPKMNENYNLLDSYIKLTKISLLLSHTSLYEYTQSVLNSLIHSKIQYALSEKLFNQSIKDKYLIKKSEIKDVPLKNIRTKIVTIDISEDLVLMDIFNDFNLTNKETIVESFNIVLKDIIKLRHFVSSFLLVESKKDIEEIKDIELLKYIARRIMKTYGIPIKKNIPIDKSDLLANLKFNTLEVEESYYYD